VSAIRLFILGTLAERGPLHGHQLRLQAMEDRTEQWADIKPGALYGALTRLERDGLITVLRTERDGNYPERVVYAITAEGQRTLTTLHDQMLRAVVVPTDPFDLALAHAPGIARETLDEIVNARLLDYRARLASAKSQLLAAEPWLTPAEHIVCEHVIARLETEVAWHEELLNRKIISDPVEGPA
jgi:DNA-binding PadR family transcriptional regulator